VRHICEWYGDFLLFFLTIFFFTVWFFSTPSSVFCFFIFFEFFLGVEDMHMGITTTLTSSKKKKATNGAENTQMATTRRPINARTGECP